MYPEYVDKRPVQCAELEYKPENIRDYGVGCSGQLSLTSVMKRAFQVYVNTTIGIINCQKSE